MAAAGYISQAPRRKAAGRARLGLHPSTVPLQSGCTSPSLKDAAFFCDYVLAVMKSDPAYTQAYKPEADVGGLKIYTTLNPKDQRAAQHAVNYVAARRRRVFNPGHNVDTEVLIQPGTGYVRAIAVDRPVRRRARGTTNVDYAVDTKYDGGEGVQTGSSSKLFTLVTALKQGIPFGFNQKIVSPTVVGGFTNCHGQLRQPAGRFTGHERRGHGSGIFTLYNGTTQSINVFYAHLEQKVGLCNVVKTAVSTGRAPRRRHVAAEVEQAPGTARSTRRTTSRRSRSARSTCRR